MFCHVMYEPGTVVRRHAHETAEQVMWIVDGAVTRTIGDETKDLVADDVVVVIRGIEHERVNICRSETARLSSSPCDDSGLRTYQGGTECGRGFDSRRLHLGSTETFRGSVDRTSFSRSVLLVHDAIAAD